MSREKKFEGIEVLRAIAVFMTVFAHLPITTAPFIGTSIRSPWFMGVPIFFGISGWIIASVTDRYSYFNIPEFLMRRLFRIVPILLLSCAFSMLISLALPRSEIVDQFYPDIWNTVRVTALNLLFISDFAGFLGVHTPHSLLGLWSIAVEFKFYFVFAAILLLDKRFRIHALLLILLLSLVVRWQLVLQGSAWGFSHVYFVESMILGAISHELKFSEKLVIFLKFKSSQVLSIALCFIYLMIFPSIPHAGLYWYVAYIFEVIVCIFLVNLAVVFTLKDSKIVTFLKGCGARSYSLYVFHFQFISLGG